MQTMNETLATPARTTGTSRLPGVSPGGRLDRDRGLALLAALAIYVAAYCAWSLASRLPAATRSFRSDLAFLPVGLTVVLLALRAARAPELDRATRRAWRLISAALFFFWLGDLLWFGSSWIWPDPRNGARGFGYVAGQAAYVVYYLPLLLGLLSFPRFLRTRTEALQFWLDVLTVFLGGLMLLWSVLVAPLAAVDTGNLAGLVLSIGYPMGDLILLFGMAVVAVRRRDEGARFVLLPLTIALTATLLNDSIFSVLSLSGLYESGSSVDMISMIAWLLFGTSAVAQWHFAPRAPETRAAAGGAGAMSVVPYLAVIAGYGSLFLAALDRRTPTLGGIVIGAIALTATVLVRQVVAVRDNVRLSAESAAKRARRASGHWSSTRRT